MDGVVWTHSSAGGTKDFDGVSEIDGVVVGVVKKGGANAGKCTDHWQKVECVKVFYP